MSLMGELSFFLGLQIKQSHDGTFINQSKYAKELIKKFGMEKGKAFETRMSPSTCLETDNAGKDVDEKLYRGMIGSLLYLTASRPDIMYSVCKCARFQSAPKESHLTAETKMIEKVLLAFVGLKAPCREQARKVVMDCQDAGVNIKIITKDDIHTARASAIDCGIIDPHDTSTGEVIEGTTFQGYAEDERLEKVDNIRVIARASTLDKLLMVRCLQKKGHNVAVTGDRVEDAEALREANVGLSLGNHGTDAARNCSDIVIMDDNFASIARVLSWGQTTYNNVQIFTQYQLTATIASLVIDFVTAISASEPVTINIVTVISAGNVPYAMLQVLWVKLMVGTLAAVALTIDGPGTKLMQQPPTDKNEPFITNIMWKNILGQALYLISVLLTIQFTGESGYQLSDKEKDTMIFNIFVLCQLFNIFYLRNYEGGLLRELKTKQLFWGIVGMIVDIQFAMIEMLKEFACTERLNWMKWKVCIGIAALSWPVSRRNSQNSRFRSGVRL
ncbi:hypothetical protein KY289_037118 [Solanum tuberosum]|nr:hypothetical protein KY284_036955 [Solanum tuberosum]KAH0637203.1 hypothetical protein KY289_037118 [Solanum tuberosum]